MKPPGRFITNNACLLLIGIVFICIYSNTFVNVEASPRKCPVFQCIPFLLSTDIGKVSQLFNYEALIGLTVKDDQAIEAREAAIQEACTSYLRFDRCFGGDWWECFDLTELLKVAKEAFSSLQLPGGGSLTQLTEDQVTVGLKVTQFSCENWGIALNNSRCIRESIVRNTTLYNYFVQAGFDMSHRPDTINCDRFRELFHLFIYGLATNCDYRLANATNHVLRLSMQAIPNFNLSSCSYMSFREIMATPPDYSVLLTSTTESAPTAGETTATATTATTVKPTLQQSLETTTVTTNQPDLYSSRQTLSAMNAPSTTTGGGTFTTMPTTTTTTTGKSLETATEQTVTMGHSHQSSNGAEIGRPRQTVTMAILNTIPAFSLLLLLGHQVV